ncbi:hypothetical protein CLHUN_17340 [Ruminiclostridium hungatei]|uniref:Gram-positive cocci surface proteins LPxTG domain-containing protein n=1 Tax=Ruminiclostridium hungatei TaxID=48256 RepID=A0A1V4SLS5_RUMHU|nr:hypothetical protein [Ruminiclostridium hungatei]OPX44435.1 hypothetical protein CLHUN_17340 [Ruminiclostridium hungatei]
MRDIKLFGKVFAGTFALSMCLLVFSTAANAAVNEDIAKAGSVSGGGNTGMATSSVSPDKAVSSPVMIDEAILKKQKEIDAYLFKEHAKEVEQKGITVTHTVPFEEFVEIGILPLTEENQEYLYGIFGKEQVRIVEGQKAVIMYDGNTVEPAPGIAQQGSAPGAAGVMPEPYMEDLERDVNKGAAVDAADDGRMYKSTSASGAAEIYATAAIAENSGEKADRTLWIALGTGGAAAIALGGVILLRRKKTAAN